MEPTAELIAALDREDLEIAKRMTGAQKFLASGDLFDDACRWTMAGIRHRQPDISDAEVLVELRRIIEIGDRLEWTGGGQA